MIFFLTCVFGTVNAVSLDCGSYIFFAKFIHAEGSINGFVILLGGKSVVSVASGDKSLRVEDALRHSFRLTLSTIRFCGEIK